MVQLTLTLDDETVREIDAAAKAADETPEDWVAAAIRERLPHEEPVAHSDSPSQAMERLLALYGTWEDDRTSDEILRDIRAADMQQRAREPFL